MTPPVGRVVRKGRIRVDARKAMAKLREHLLVDLHLYALEAVRAAVLAGATHIAVTFDADDVVLAWDGRPLDVEALPRLFEHLLGETDGEDARHLRLLALAVNAALGLQPAWVTLTTARDGAAARVTWSPALVAAIEREEKPLPDVETIPLPADMPRTGTRFHLHRKMGWETVRRATAKTPPREVNLLVESAHCLRVPLDVNGKPLSVPTRQRTLARAAITLPGVKLAHLEIVTGTSTAPHVDFCELGVLLTRTGFAFGSRFPMSEHLGVAPPVRIVVDADALPTNASRSAVREDAPLFGALRSAAAPALADAITGLIAASFGRGAVPEGVTVELSDPGALREALGAFLCVAEASILARVALPEALQKVLDLPLFEDGLGRPITHAEVSREDPLLVWEGDAPVPEEMAPWAHHIVWRKGHVADRILATRRCLPPEELAALAKRGANRRKKLLAMPPGEASVPDAAHLARERFAFRDGPFGGLTGEVAIAADPAAYVRNLGLRVFLDGRCFEAFPVPEDVIPLPCLIALAWPDHIGPKFAYEGVEPTAGLRAAIAFAARHAVLLCERFAAERPRSGQPEGAAQATVLRAALATAALAPRKMCSAQGFEMPPLEQLTALLNAPIWPTTEGPFTSLEALCDHAATTGALCVAASVRQGRAADGRPVVSLPSAELAWLSACLRPGLPLVRYDAALLAGTRSPRSRTRPAIGLFIDTVSAAIGAPILYVEAKAFSFAVTLGAVSETRVWHGGVCLSVTTLDETFGGVVIALDDDSIVPTADWRAVAHAADQGLAGRAERAFAERLVDALQGDESARRDLFGAITGEAAGGQRERPASVRATVHRGEDLEPSSGARRYVWPERPVDLPYSVHRYLVDRAARGRAVDASEEDRAIGARIELLPFLTMIGDEGVPVFASLADVGRRHPDRAPIPHLRAAPPFKPVGWHPLIVINDSVLDALSRWSGSRLLDGRLEIVARERSAALEGRLALHRAKPTLDPMTVGPRGDTTGPVIAVPARHGISGVAVALPAPSLEIGCALVEVLFEDRLVCERPLTRVLLAVVGRVATATREAIRDFDDLSASGEAEAAARLTVAATALALDLLERARRPGAARTFFGDARALRLVLDLLQLPSRDARIENALRHVDVKWPTVQGEERSFTDLFHVDGSHWAGTVSFPSWLPPQGPATDLDRPILHLAPSPEGSLLTGILEKLNVHLHAVSYELAALQQKRAQGASTDKPRLGVRPAHPRLAQDLDALQLQGVEGEMALFESGESLASVTGPSGETRRVPLDLGFTARAVVRVDVLTSATVPILSEKLSRAAVRLLLGLVPEIESLPSFVRAHLRALTCRALSKDRAPPTSVRSAPLFEDVDGAWLSLDELSSGALGDLSCTFDPPPYAKARQEGRTLRLSRTEHLQLVRKIKLLNVTEWMRRDLDCERRREAPPHEHIRFDAAARAHFGSDVTVNEGSMEGEIGLLDPMSTSARGIQIFQTRRPLCKIDDAPGWPIAAVVNDDTLRPTRWFDGVLPGSEKAVRERVRAIATRHIRAVLEAELPPESERLATVFVDEEVPAVTAYGSTEPMIMTGFVYLPRRWPESPQVSVRIQAVSEFPPTAIRLASAPIQSSLPMGGALLVAHDAPDFSRGAGFRLAIALRGGLEAMLAPLLRAAPSDPELLAYHWNLRFLGSTALGEPAAVAADGSPVQPSDVIDLLHGSSDLWLTDRAGWIEGAFPEGTVPFVLRDDGSPLVRVLAARVPKQRFKTLGAPPPPSRRAEALAPPSRPPPPGGEEATFDAADASHRTSRSWLGAVLGRVTGLLSSAPAAEPAPTGIAAAVERALRAMRLREEPVVLVAEVHRGRLVRYDPKRRAVLINVAHPEIARHVAAASPAAIRRVCIALVTAALSEVNIALEHVTDHDEGQALLELLRQEAAAAAGEQPL